VTPGFFGKVPGRGDFLARRVPAGIGAAWEAWLSDLVVAARAALGESWPNDWLTAPLWHFVLGKGVAPPTGAAGVLVASVDRVGRFFPFTIIGAGTASSAPDHAALDGWARVVEALALDSLEDGFDPDILDAALRTLGAPSVGTGAMHVTGHWALTLEDGWPSRVDEAESCALRLPGADQSAWWCRGGKRMAPLQLRCAGLPDPDTAAAMITGAFDGKI
jgi:type VI secretion system protein ImpM